MKKLGLDLHGVITAKPESFSKLSHRLFNSDWEIHIITGSLWTEKIEKQLKALNIKWTHHFSISDYLLRKKEKVTWQDNENPWFDKEKWNRAKGEYCKKEKITLHIDDSTVYEKYFETPYLNINDISFNEHIYKWYENIEDPLKDLVKYLRNNGINTECSCGHEMIIQCQCIVDGQLKDLHDLLFLYFHNQKEPINYTIDIHHEVKDGFSHNSVFIKLPVKS